MVDFPSSPVAGDRHTENGSSWVYKSPPGIWAVETGDAGTPQTIVEADATAGWQVWGDTLIQWGTIDLVATRTVTFTQAFKTPPNVTASISLSAQTASTNGQFVQGHDINTTYCVLRSYNGANGSESNSRPASWIAIGEAPDDLKKPKTVQTVGGAELQQFFDPTGAASYEISGNKLECWGWIRPPVAGSLVVPLPKTFAVAPAITCTVDEETFSSAGRQSTVAVHGATTSQFTAEIRTQVDAGNPFNSALPFYWRAVGEWDGIS